MFKILSLVNSATLLVSGYWNSMLASSMGVDAIMVWCFLWYFCRNYSFAYHSVQDVAAMYPDRVITIKGTIDSMSGGEAAISNILRECYDKEAQMAMVSLGFIIICFDPIPRNPCQGLRFRIPGC